MTGRESTTGKILMTVRNSKWQQCRFVDGSEQQDQFEDSFSVPFRPAVAVDPVPFKHHKIDAVNKMSQCIHWFAEYARTTTSGWQGAPYIRSHGLELVSKPAISSKKSWGGYRRTTPSCLRSPVMRVVIGLHIQFTQSWLLPKKAK